MHCLQRAFSLFRPGSQRANRRCFLGSILFLLLAAGSALAAQSPPGPSVNYFGQIKPLLAAHCYKCHGADEAKNGLRLNAAPEARAGGKSGGPAIVPGHSEQSELIRRVSSPDADERMPPQGPPLTTQEVALLKRWIDEGASWPARDEYWAFQPPRDPPIPSVSNLFAVANPIDHFIVAGLEAVGLKPNPTAEARTLLRRAFADLIGLPPTPEEAEEFLQDPAPDAYERLVDRLLADPRYGERWARHWLDLARYGESDGYEDDKVRPHAWRYRDYVIRSLNADKPYDRFVQEQIAGDELWPTDPQAWIATGFARLGSWDGMSKEPAQQRQDFLNDVTDAVGSVFLGITLGCARCHDHKYDLITQRDYYSLQAFFAGVKRETRDLGTSLEDPLVVRETFAREREKLSQRQSERETLLRRGRAALEQERSASPAQEGRPKITDAEVARKAEKLQPGRLNELAAEIKSLEQQQRLYAPDVDAVFNHSAQPPPTHVLKGGDVRRTGAEVSPQFIEAMLPLGPSNGISGREKSAHQTRADLARWLTAPEQPLTARIIVNRLWQHHFGTGLVATPSDFGRNGRSPTHPTLLDWLAVRLVRDGYSLKKMHWLMMTSATYQRSSAFQTAAAAQDPENKLWWQMPRQRLEGEAVRDTILAVSGLLYPAMGGPGVYARLPRNVAVELPNNDKDLSWGTGSEEDNRRRSIYLFQRRSLTFPLLEVFDGAPMSQSCAVRARTTVAPQALALFNGEFCRDAAHHFASRLRGESGEDAQRIERAFELAFSRPPTSRERAEALHFLATQAEARGSAGEVARDQALVDFCHVLLNANELIYPD